MGKGAIISEYGQGRYQIDVLYDRERYDAIIAELNARIITLDEAIARIEAKLSGDPENTTFLMELKFAKIKKASAEKRIEYMEDNAPASERRDAWCADYSEKLEGDVATIEIPGYMDAGTVQIAPGWSDGAAWNRAKHGFLAHAATETPSGVFYNWALKPYWQRWKPMFRRATILSIDKVAESASVLIEDATAVEQNLNVNQETTTLENVPFDYMSCGVSAFNVDDEVVVKFRGQETGAGWTDPVIIGFQTNPKMCGFFCLAYATGDLIRFRVNQHERSFDLESAVRTAHLALGFPSGSFGGIDEVIAVNFADEYPFRIGVLVEMSPVSGKWAVGKYAVVMIDVNTENLEMTVEDVFYYSLFQDIGDDNYRITGCDGQWVSSETDPDDLPVDLGDVPHENTCVKNLTGDCTAGQLNAGTNCHTYLCCHRYFCPSTGEYVDCSEDPCQEGDGECHFEDGGGVPGPMWCSSWIGAECIDWQEHYQTCEQAFRGDPCGSYFYNYGDCTPAVCETWEGCGTSLVTVLPLADAVPIDCGMTGGSGPIPFALSFTKDSAVPEVYLYGSRETTRLDQTFSLSGTQCVEKFLECGCTTEWSGASEEHLAVQFPTGMRATAGVDIWAVDAPDLYEEYSTGSRAVVLFHDGYVSRTTSRGMCNSNWTTLNSMVATNFFGLGSAKFAYNAIRGLFNYYDPGGWVYENLGFTPEVYGVDFEFPDTPDGEDPDNGDWILFNTIRDSSQAGVSLIYDWGSAYFRSTSSLGHNLSLKPGLDSPLDDYNRVACLISNRDAEGNPGFAVCTTAAKVLCFGRWDTDEPEGGVKTLLPSGDAAYTWDIALPLNSWKSKAAFFCGNVPGVFLSL